MYGVTSYWKGKTLPDSIKQKISDKRRQPVNQIDMKTKEIIQTFSCAEEAAKKLSIGKGGIHNCLSPNQPSKSSGGFLWEYA